MDFLILALYYLSAKSDIDQLCPFSAVFASMLYVWVEYFLYFQLKSVKSKKSLYLHIFWPSIEDKKASAALLEKIRRTVPLLKEFFGITNDGQFKCQNYGDTDLQVAYSE